MTNFELACPGIYRRQLPTLAAEGQAKPRCADTRSSVATSRRRDQLSSCRIASPPPHRRHSDCRCQRSMQYVYGNCLGRCPHPADRTQRHTPPRPPVSSAAFAPSAICSRPRMNRKPGPTSMLPSAPPAAPTSPRAPYQTLKPRPSKSADITHYAQVSGVWTTAATAVASSVPQDPTRGTCSRPPNIFLVLAGTQQSTSHISASTAAMSSVRGADRK